MGQPAELLDVVPLDFEPVRDKADDCPMSARRALAVWVGLSAGGWGLVAALLGLASF